MNDIVNDLTDEQIDQILAGYKKEYLAEHKIDSLTKFCVLYLRVSDPKQLKNFSLRTQLERCMQKAIELGYFIEKVFCERAESAKDIDRKELTDLLSFCTKKENRIDAAIFYMYSRLNRDTKDFLSIRFLLAKSGVEVISASEPYGTTPEMQFIQTLLVAVAELDNKQKSKRSKEGMRKRFEEGYALSVPRGYKLYKKDTKSKSVVVKDEESFEKIKSVFYRIRDEKLCGEKGTFE